MSNSGAERCPHPADRSKTGTWKLQWGSCCSIMLPVSPDQREQRAHKTLLTYAGPHGALHVSAAMVTISISHTSEAECLSAINGPRHQRLETLDAFHNDTPQVRFLCKGSSSAGKETSLHENMDSGISSIFFILPFAFTIKVPGRLTIG